MALTRVPIVMLSPGQMVVDTFTGDGATTVFTLSADPVSKNNTWVEIDGVYQAKSQYSYNSATLQITFTVAPPTGAGIEVVSGLASPIASITDFSVTASKLSAPPLIPSVGRNIQARTNATTPNTKIDASADYFTVRDASGNFLLLSSLSGTVDFGTVGANGLDASTQAASTWYYIFAIAKADGTKALLGSASSSAPTLPSGYTYFGLISAVRSNASTQFTKFRQFGNRVYYEAMITVLSAGTASTSTAISLVTAVPPNASIVIADGRVDVTAGAGASACTCTFEIVAGSAYLSHSAYEANNTQNGESNLCFEFPNIGQNINYFRVLANVATGGTADLRVLGFVLPIAGA